MATIGYRSGPEWANRFGHKRVNPDSPPDFCPDFLIETYLDRQVHSYCTQRRDDHNYGDVVVG